MKETKNNPEEKIIDQSAAERILNSMPDDEYLYDLSECFRIFGGYSENSGKPHPEHGSRAAESYRSPDTYDIAGADG